MTAVEWGAAAPVLALLGAAFACVACDLFFPRSRERGAPELITYAGLVAAMLFSWGLQGGVAFGGSLVADGLARFVTMAVLVATMLAAVASADALSARRILLPEYFALLLSAAAGMILLAMSQDLITMFLSVEILSLALYVLCGITRQDPRSNESAMKYFVLGSFATGFLLYGMTLIYAASGSVFLETMALRLPGISTSLTLAGIGLLIAGFAFKIGAAPFHMWVPDVYEGAPTPVTAFMSVAVKTAAIGALVRLLVAGLPGQEEGWGPLIGGIAALTMIVGNLGALAQRSVKRMLAWSSVAHSGYALIGLAVAAGPADGRIAGEGPAAALFYAAAYTVMTIGAFLFLMFAGRAPTAVSPGREAETYDDLNGLARRRPWSAALMTLLMVSLAGIPPTAGFFGKFTLFRAAVNEGYGLLAVLAVLTSVVSAVYYLRVVVSMYMKEPPASPERAEETADRPDLSAGLAVAVSAVLTLYLGLMPGPVLEWARSAVDSLLR
jgi:NADH-quinone oxidoreductase subunit N